MSIKRIAAIIAVELERFAREDETLADAVRYAAVFAREEFPDMTSAEFGDAAVTLGLHRQGSRNRFNEAMKFLADCAS